MVSIIVSQSLISSGSVDTFTAVAPAAGSFPVYQWYVDGNSVPGVTGPVYITDSLQNGQTVKCAVTSSLDCAAPPTAMSGGIKVVVAPVGTKGIVDPNTNFALVPNPNKGEFEISGTFVSLFDTRANIRVTNMLGQVVYSRNIVAVNGSVNEKIKLSNNIASGMYLVTLTSGEDHIVFQVVVNK
jgi:hypothetical protein